MFNLTLGKSVVASMFLFCLAGCGGGQKMVPFNDALAEKYGLDDTSLPQLQYYTAASITLAREVLSDHKVSTANGKLVERQGKVFEGENRGQELMALS